MLGFGAWFSRGGGSLLRNQRGAKAVLRSALLPHQPKLFRKLSFSAGLWPIIALLRDSSSPRAEQNALTLAAKNAQ
jgi:hypothetical protein